MPALDAAQHGRHSTPQASAAHRWLPARAAQHSTHITAQRTVGAQHAQRGGVSLVQVGQLQAQQLLNLACAVGACAEEGARAGQPDSCGQGQVAGTAMKLGQL